MKRLWDCAFSLRSHVNRITLNYFEFQFFYRKVYIAIENTMKSFAFAVFCIICDVISKCNGDVSVALCYAYNPPVGGLSKFDWAAVDSDAQFDPKNVQSDSQTVWLSYLSVGEVKSDRSYFKDIPKSWFMGDNIEWESHIINQTAQGWPDFFINTIARPLVKRGFKGFFLDTLDSYQRVSNTDQQREGLSNVINRLKAEFPDAILIFNRGFEIMSKVHRAANMVAFESLYSGWNQGEKKYVRVKQEDRDWLLARSEEIKSKYALPVLAIDYYPPGNTTWANEVAKQIQKHNIIPYVTDPGLQTVGIGPPNMD